MFIIMHIKLDLILDDACKSLPEAT